MGASEAQITKVERYFGVRFPDDYRRSLAAQGSIDQFVPPAGDYLTIYPIDQIIEINQAGSIPERFPGAVVIGGDGSREMLVYDFREDPPALVLLDITAEGWPAALYQAPSLTALLEQFPQRGWSFEEG
jgi:SMI1 / KNR4 family (SUKH-1)